MLFIPAGESHSNGYLGGLALLEALAPNMIMMGVMGGRA